MNHTLAIERRLMRSLTPNPGRAETDTVIDRLLADPMLTAGRLLEVTTRLQHGAVGSPIERIIGTSIFAGIAVEYALQMSPDFRASIEKWLSEDESSGRQKIIEFADIRNRRRPP